MLCFQGSAKLLRDARGLPTYRALDCHHLAPFPDFERTHVFWMQSDGIAWHGMAALCYAVLGRCALARCPAD
jgi:hypothetical protein